MRYYFDLLVNLDTCFWNYYEWDVKDHLLNLKKVPMIRVKEDVLHTFLTYDILLTKDFCAPYLGKALVRKSKEKLNCLLFCDGQDSLVLEFDDHGKILSRSRLLISDDLHCAEMVKNFPLTSVKYQTLQQLIQPKDFRKALEDKRLIQIELDTLEQSKNVSKCAFLYYEWFGEKEQNMDKMLKRCREELNKEYTLKMHEIASLILLSYKGCL